MAVAVVLLRPVGRRDLERGRLALLLEGLQEGAWGREVRLLEGAWALAAGP